MILFLLFVHLTYLHLDDMPDINNIFYIIFSRVHIMTFKKEHHIIFPYQESIN